jgi:hypothetical protein
MVLVYDFERLRWTKRYLELELEELASRGLASSWRARSHQARLRLTRYLIAKIRLLQCQSTTASKKAVCERSFFVLHETHPPALTVIYCGLFAGAFQAA